MVKLESGMELEVFSVSGKIAPIYSSLQGNRGADNLKMQ